MTLGKRMRANVKRCIAVIDALDDVFAVIAMAELSVALECVEADAAVQWWLPVCFGSISRSALTGFKQ
jgi:hypothetical protein